ncbi:hypothetical protein GCM10023194_32800 [Planotetraspora phitsanulokensis]|uniref:Uncharacterized protein n=1 Tax=Planotetraspora phitsanulokensis TaxID=575192 RepID=A0A8J3U1D3_9ACTN|nr:hypothetical protein Pph01_05840 [Planotetraspora phitsanulokensis]
MHGNAFGGAGLLADLNGCVEIGRTLQGHHTACIDTLYAALSPYVLVEPIYYVIGMGIRYHHTDLRDIGPYWPD